MRFLHILIAASLCALGSFAHAQQADPVKVRVGGTGAMPYLPFFVGMEEGFFTKHGIEIDRVTITNPLPALISGDLDFSTGTADSAIIAAAQGKRTPAIMMMQQRNSYSLTVRADLPMPNASKGYPDKLQDLKGKTIGVVCRGCAAETFVKQLMGGANMEEGRDYNVVVIASPVSIIAALKTGEIDGANLFSPFQERAWLDKIGVPMIEQVKEGPAGLNRGAGSSINANPDFLAKHPDVAKKFIAAMTEAEEFTRDLQNNKDRLIDITMQYTSATEQDSIAMALSTISSLAYPGIDCDAWNASAKGLMSVGSLTSTPACEDVTAQDIAPKEPTGPVK